MHIKSTTCTLNTYTYVCTDMHIYICAFIWRAEENQLNHIMFWLHEDVLIGYTSISITFLWSNKNKRRQGYWAVSSWEIGVGTNYIHKPSSQMARFISKNEQQVIIQSRESQQYFTLVQSFIVLKMLCYQDSVGRYNISRLSLWWLLTIIYQFSFWETILRLNGGGRRDSRHQLLLRSEDPLGKPWEGWPEQLSTVNTTSTSSINLSHPLPRPCLPITHTAPNRMEREEILCLISIGQGVGKGRGWKGLGMARYLGYGEKSSLREAFLWCG